ncbi:MAG: hypothetical protein QXE63_03555 [Zestosphaera sp.]
MDAVKEIIIQGISKIVEMFQPVIRRIFMPPELIEGGEQGSQSSSEKKLGEGDQANTEEGVR